jgi:hypothetical protein
VEFIHERAKALQMCYARHLTLTLTITLTLTLTLTSTSRFGRHADAVLDFTTVLNARPRFANARFRRAFSFKRADF